MLNNLNDFMNIDQRIDKIERERTELAERLQTIEKARSLNSDKTKYLSSIANDILEKVQTIEDVYELKSKYGDLMILNDLEQEYEQNIKFELAVKKIESIETEIDELAKSDIIDLDINKVNAIHAKLYSSLEDCTLHNDDTYVQMILNKFDSGLITRYAEKKSEELNKLLLDYKWDTAKFLLSDSESTKNIRDKSSELFKLTSLYFNKSEKKLWNFMSMANNFKIRFTYHFHDSSSDIEMYFKFLNDYLNENLYKCINIFYDNSVGLTKGLIHEQFINHVLEPMRDRVNITLSQNDLKSLIILISQIISTDINLVKTYHYHGNGLASLVSDSVWETWMNFETETTMSQYRIITENPKELATSAHNILKLLTKVYKYFKPFYELDYEPLEKYKLMTCSQIFLKLFRDYHTFVLMTNSLSDQHTKDDELLQTLNKMENLNIVANKLRDLEQSYIFSKLVKVVNERESKDYITLFDDILHDYEFDLQHDMCDSVVHRIQAMVKESLKNYFKLGSWKLENVGDEPTSELVDGINILKRINHVISTIDIPDDIKTDIKCRLVNIIVTYFVESILKLNQFNEQGLCQLKKDYLAMIEILDVSTIELVSNNMLLETLKVLWLKYDPDCEKYINSAYIKQGNFEDLRSNISLRFLDDSEIQDALYRISYGNIV